MSERLNDSLDPKNTSQKIILEINERNEKLYGPYHSKCGLFESFCRCGKPSPNYKLAKNKFNSRTGFNKGKINTVVSEIQGLIQEFNPSDEESFLNYIGDILCQFDTDIAIEVMEGLGEIGKNESRRIKIVYGY